MSAVGLVACSLITLKGADQGTVAGHPLYYVERQAIFAGVGLLLALAISRIDYSQLREYKYGLFAVMVALNLVVYGMPPIQNARRWIPLPLLNFQSSEFGKILVIVALAAFAVDRSRRLHEWRTTARIMLLALVASLLVIPQPDLGTGMVYVVIGFSILFFAGTSWKQLTALATLFIAALVIALVVGPALGFHVLNHYQEQRLVGFLHPSSDPQGATYNIHQSLIAIGSGQKTGRGALGDADHAGISVGQLDGLCVRGGRRDLWVRRLCRRALAVRAADLAHAADPDDVQEPLRDADRRGDPGDADVPGVRQRRDDDRNHADHRCPITARELRRLVGDRDVHRHRPAAVDLHPGTDFVGWQGQGASFVSNAAPIIRRAATDFQKD